MALIQIREAPPIALALALRFKRFFRIHRIGYGVVSVVSFGSQAQFKAEFVKSRSVPLEYRR